LPPSIRRLSGGDAPSRASRAAVVVHAGEAIRIFGKDVIIPPIFGGVTIRELG
jgi:hypothetical protein